MQRTQDSIPQPKPKKHRRTLTFITAAQSCFLTTKFYLKNRLVSYASASTFGFLYSSIPVLMMILVILIRFLHASPVTVSALLSFASHYREYLNLQSVINSILAVHKIGLFEVIIGLSIFWLARSFFASIIYSMQCIFHTEQQRKPIITQILTFAVEVLFVVLIAATVFLFLSLKTILSLPLIAGFFSRYPGMQSTFNHRIFLWLPNILIFLLVSVTYKAGPGTKPPHLLCLFSAAACTASFWVVRQIMHLFVNLSRYNLIYGVLGKLIVILLEVFFFFTLFLFFAQFIFVSQFFDELLLGELYLLPRRDSPGLSSLLRRTLFIRPDYLMAKDVNMIHLKEGGIVFTKADTGTDAYYVVRGTVAEIKKNGTTYYDRGDFFGELTCVLSKPRDGTAKAVSDNVEIVRIDGDTFRMLLTQNPDVAVKVLGQISSYFAKVYGRTDGFLL